MKQYLTKGALALVLGGFLTSCSHEEFDISTYVADKVKAYEQVFVSEFGSIDPNQDWGFGSTTSNSGQARRMTRATATWTDNHNHVDGCTGWEEDLNFKSEAEVIAAGAVRLDANGYEADGKVRYKIPNGSILYVSSSFDGELLLDEGFNSDCTIYNYGKISKIQVNYINSKITYYNAGTLTFDLSSGTHTLYNNGKNAILIINKYDNINEVYNGAHLELTNADLRSGLKVHSTDVGTVYFPNGAGSGDGLQSTLDIHGTATVKGNMSIGNSNTQYVCGLKVSGRLYLNKGHLQTSYVEANEIEFNGDILYLLPGGHVIANTIKMPNSGIYVKGHEGSTALIEVGNIIMQNTCNFEDTFSDNVYFDISGYIDLSAATSIGGKAKKWNSAEEYAAQYPLNGYNEGDNVSGSPACGDAWSIGTGGGDEMELPIEDPTEGTGVIKRYHKTTKLKESGRVFCEDLGKISSNDMDFNDVVFDAYIYEVTYSTETIGGDNPGTINTGTEYECDIFLLAAGGTLPLTIADDKEVHNQFGVGTGTIVNTITEEKGSYGNSYVSGKGAKKLEGTYTYSSIKDIPVVTQYSNGEILILDAKPGEVPHKFCVPIGTPWAKERVKMKDAYPGFKDYVNNSQEFCNSGDSEYLYPNIEYKYSIEDKEKAGTKLIKEENEGSASSGGYQGTEVLSRERR